LVAEADTVELLAAVERACHGWNGSKAAEIEPLHLRLKVGANWEADRDTTISADKWRLQIDGRWVAARADASRGRAECVVAGNHQDRPALQDEVLDTLILFLATRRDRTPIHAAGFVADGFALLLAGRSGSGKSCLALAAHEAGFALLSDDTVYIEQRPKLRIWGLPRPIHLFAEDMPSGSCGGIRIRGGKAKHVLPVNMPARAVTADRAVLCVLGRGTSASLARIGQREALAELGSLEEGFDLLKDEIEAALALLTRNGAWRLTLSADPAEAIEVLRANLPLLNANASP